MSGSASATRDNTKQHEKLRKRLQDELMSARTSLDSGDYDWFLRGSNFSAPAPHPSSPIKSPSLASSNNSKALPSVSTTDANLVKTSGGDTLVPLTRAKTLEGLVSSTKKDSEYGTGLARTSTNISTSNVGRRRSVGSTANPEPVKKKGFFKKLFGKKEDEPPITRSRSNSTTSSASTSYTKRSSVSQPPTSPVRSSSSDRRKIDGFMEPKEERPEKMFDSGAGATVSEKAVDSTVPASEKYRNVDPKLYEYLKEIEHYTQLSVVDEDFDGYSVFAPTADTSVRYDPGIIPPHPDKPKLPSAFAQHPRYNKSVELELFEQQKREREQQQREGGVFGSILRLTKTNQDKDPHELMRIKSNEAVAEEISSLSAGSLSYTPPPPKVEKAPPFTVLKKLKPMKKVAFATTTFVNDPPQQIPSRNPRKGNVEVGPDGELIIHKIDPEEKASTTAGLVVGGSGHLKMTHAEGDESSIESGASSAISTSSSTMKRTPSTSSMDLTIKREDKQLAAEKARNQVMDERQKDGIKIDKPMVRRKKKMEKPVVTLKLDELYTRCCHLREILPIPATLKQIPKGSTDPLPILHLRNPRPSLVEVLSFSDFIRIAPIQCVSLDGVSLTVEMFRIILSSLVYKRYLEKISLRNTPIDSDGWKLICWFLSMNKALKRLDLTQCPPLSLSTQRLKKGAHAPDHHERMQCNSQDRSDMDWSLLTATLVVRGGIDEMVLSGCKINDLKVFKNFMNIGLANALKIGLAYNELTYNHCEIIADWLSRNKNCVGIDLGYNDLSTSLKPFVAYAKSLHYENNLALTSLNSCNLIDSEETGQLFDLISKFPHLKYLDISNNKRLFPNFMGKLTTYLPLFQELARLALDNNDLSPVCIIQLSETLPLVKHLNHLSITGNHLNETCCASLYHSLRNSKSIYSFDFDTQDTPQSYQEKIGLITMRNMELALYGNPDSKSSPAGLINHDDSEFLDKPFAEMLMEILSAGKDVDSQKLEKFFKYAQKLQERLHSTINELMVLHRRSQLNFEGKETLIRLITIDASIKKGLQLINHEYGKLYNQSTVVNASKFLIENSQNYSSEDMSSSALSSSEKDEETVNLTSDVRAVPLNKTPSDASLKMMEDEAKTFKISRFLAQQQKDEQIQEAESAKHEGSLLSSLASKDGKIDKETIRGALMSSRDVGEFVSALNRLKVNGISLSDLYTKKTDATESNTIMNTRRTIFETPDADSVSEEGKADGDKDSIDSEDLSLESLNEAVAAADIDESDPKAVSLSAAYDSVLAELSKRRQ